MYAPCMARESESWRAALEMRLGLRAGRTRLLSSRHEGPLRLQRAFHPEEDGTAHVVVLHPPGGLVSGDDVTVDATLEADARGLLTNTGATKLYRTRGHQAVIRTRLRAAAGAHLEHVPQETVVYDDAEACCDTRVDLEAGARLLAWEVVCLGRPAASEAFARGSLTLRFEVWREGEPLFVDRGCMDGGSTSLTNAAGMRGHPAFGTLVATSCEPAALRAALEAAVGDDGTWGVTTKGDLTVVRALGRDGLQVRERFAIVRHAVRDAWGRERIDPAIWRS